jgi:cellulose synthase/poly-beta-1,6-N-acetylglucosamine synthase-like glycosyltransferase
MVLVDADARLDADFLEQIVAPLADPGVDAVQGLYAVSNLESSRQSATIGLGFILKNQVRNLGRSSLGGSANLYGSGMGFRREMLVRTGFPSPHSLGEDQ